MFTNRFGDSGKEPGQLDHPGPIVLDGQKRLYVAMSGRIDRLQQRRADGDGDRSERQRVAGDE